MSEGRGKIRWACTALPAVAAAAVSGWAAWCFAGSAPPPAAVAFAGGAVLLAAACTAYWFLVGGPGGFFGALLLAMGLLLAVTAVEQATARAEVADCVVGQVRTEVQGSFGEGAPSGKTVYRFALRCPGGYPAELKDDRPVAAEGEAVRVAYDPGRRASPALEGGTAPWPAALSALLLLGLGTVIARVASRAPAG
ncbi:hypothetical protein [Streptomyces xanthophaeus]|uniref:hypothetical protein n=1 Tax=Streptomyces xanthophaeus TaxID=67385 RepID=UPI00365A5DB6